MNEVDVYGPVDVVGNAVEEFLKDGTEGGRIVTKEWLEWALELPEPTNVEDAKRCQWIAFGRIDDFRERLLRNHKVALQTLRGIGYRVVPPADQSEFALKQAAQGVVRAVSRANDIIKYTRMDSLSDEERRRHYERAGKLQTFAAFTNDEATKLIDYTKVAPKLKG